MATPRTISLQLAGSDGGPLYVDVRTGARAGERRPTAIVCHGFKGFKDWGFFPKIADRLAQAGFTAISFNFSGSGVAGGDQFSELERWRHQRPSTDLQDVGTVVDYALDEWASSISLVGHSRGGALAILHAARDPRVAALVTWAAIDHFMRFSEDDIIRWRHEGKLDVLNTRTGQVLPVGRAALDDVEQHQHNLLDVRGSAGRLGQPWLIAHGSKDPTVDVATASRLAGLAQGAAAELLIIDGGDHTFGVRHPWAGTTPHFDRLEAATVAFLARHGG